MAIYKRDMADINLETGNIHRTFLNHTIGYKDQKADHFGIRVFRDGEPVDLTGVSVQGVFMPPQGDPIAITSGNIVSGNEAEVVLPQACYNYDGQFCLAIKLVDSNNSVTGTMRIVDGMVDNTHASGTVAPTSAVPTYQEILSTYDAMVAATAAANGAIAATYSSSSTYKVGDYCIHDGGLYRCTTAITTAEAWTSGHWTAAKIGPDVSDLKSAFERECSIKYYESWASGYYDLRNDGVDITADPTSSGTYLCQKGQCNSGDYFIYTGKPANAARAYAFLNSTSGANNIITKGTGSGTYAENVVLRAPEGAKYYIFQASKNEKHEVVKITDAKAISENDDLNDYTVPGVYFSATKPITVSLKHCPISDDDSANAFKLTVEHADGTGYSNYKVQTLEVISSNTRYIKAFKRIYTTSFSEWIEISLNSFGSCMKRLNTGDDLNDCEELLTYYCPNPTTAKTLINSPFAIPAGFIMKVLNSSNPSSGEIGLRQIAFPNKVGMSTIYTRAKKTTWGGWEVLVSGSMCSNVNTVIADDTLPRARITGMPKKTINFATLNTAHYWMQGIATDYMANDPIRIANWRSWLLDSNLNMIFLQECEDYIDEDMEMSAFAYLYAPFFDCDYNIDENPGSSGTEDQSRRKILNNLGWNTECTSVAVPSTIDSKYGYYSYCTVTDQDLGTILLINVHNFDGSTSAKTEERKELLDTLEELVQETEADYFIIAGDFNSQKSDPDNLTNILNFCDDINGHPANGDLLGWFSTYNQEDTENTLDNIIVSNNIRFESIKCDPLLIPAKIIHSDHTPVVARISFM